MIISPVLEGRRKSFVFFLTLRLQGCSFHVPDLCHLGDLSLATVSALQHLCLHELGLPPGPATQVDGGLRHARQRVPRDPIIDSVSGGQPPSSTCWAYLKLTLGPLPQRCTASPQRQAVLGPRGGSVPQRGIEWGRCTEAQLGFLSLNSEKGQPAVPPRIKCSAICRWPLTCFKVLISNLNTGPYDLFSKF